MIRVFPHRTKWTPTDDMVFVGSPPLFRPEDRSIPVKISVTFTWHRSLGLQLAEAWSAFYDDVQVGGPAFGDPGSEFTPGLFLKNGCTITSRGCPRDCDFCDVTRREGEIRPLKTIHPGYIVQDNNLLACPEWHVRAVFDMLKDQGRRIFFNGGMDKYYLRDWHRPLIDSVPIGELWFACDTKRDVKPLERASRILDGIPLRKRRCYVLLGFDKEETPADAERRCETVLKAGYMPFAQLFQGEEFFLYSPEFRAVHRKWARPAAYMGRLPEYAR